MLGAEALERLSRARVAVFGVGGVGGNAVEALVRAGVGAVDIVDNDVFCESNLNRQVFALKSTLGMYKVDAAAERLHDINPDCDVVRHRTFFTPEKASQFDFTKYDYVVDAIDTVTAKIALVMSAKAAGVPIISAMGAGNKLDPTALRVTDISETSVCPLAKVMRTELRKRGVRKLKVVWSNELPMPRAADASPENGSAGAGAASGRESGTGSGTGAVTKNAVAAAAPERGNATGSVTSINAESAIKSGAEIAAGTSTSTGRRSTPGSVSFVPAVAGLIIAGEVVKDLTGIRGMGRGN